MNYLITDFQPTDDPNSERVEFIAILYPPSAYEWWLFIMGGGQLVS